jgi:hypothetical protein
MSYINKFTLTHTNSVSFHSRSADYLQPHSDSLGNFLRKMTIALVSNFLCGETVLIHTDRKENQIFPIYKEIQSGAVAQGFLIYEEMRKYFPIHKEAASHI